MISSILIKNYKCFRNLHIPDLSRIVLIGGPNGIGKTSLLEALFLFFDRSNPHMFLRHFSFRGITQVAVTSRDLMAPSFNNLSLDEPIEISLASNDSPPATLTVQFTPDFDGNEKPSSPAKETQSTQYLATSETNSSQFAFDVCYTPATGPQQEGTLVLSEDSKIIFHNSAISKHPTTAAFVGTRATIPPTDNVDRLSQLLIINKGHLAVTFLKEFDPRINSISALSLAGKPIIHAEVGMERQMPLPLLGDGITRLLTIFLAISHAENGILLLDEIGAGIHFSLLPRLWTAITKAANEFNCQIITTSHSYECIQAAAEGIPPLTPDVFTYIRLQESRDGTITHTAYPFDTFRTAIENGFEIR